MHVLKIYSLVVCFDEIIVCFTYNDTNLYNMLIHVNIFLGINFMVEKNSTVT